MSNGNGRWARRGDVTLPPPLAPTPTPYTVEQALYGRLTALRDALVGEADDLAWDPIAVDRILEAGGLPPMTREYVVTYQETAQHQVRVRATDTVRASEAAALHDDQHLVAVREATP